MSSLIKYCQKQMSLFLVFTIVLLSSTPAMGFHSQFVIPSYEQEEAFFNNIDNTPDILGALIASGVEPQNYSFYTSEIQRWKTEIQNSLPRNHTQMDLAKAIGYYLHDHVYKSYRLSATTLKEVFDTGHFNCLSGTILMNIMLRVFGIQANAIVLPTHVYTLAVLDGENSEIENTIREGLAISQDKNVQDRFNKLTGFNYESGSKKKVVVAWKETLGLLYSNRSYFDAQKRNHLQAFQNMMKAQIFLANTPSEEKNLIAGYLNYSYYTYKKTKASLQEYLKTLSILEEGIDRFPQYDNLKGNYLKGVDIVAEQMIKASADKKDIDHLIVSSERYLNPKDFQKLKKSRSIRAILHHMRTNKNYQEAQHYIQEFWEQNSKDKDAQDLVQEFSFTVVQQDIKNPQRIESNPEIFNRLEIFPSELTKEPLGCYYSGLAKNNFKAQRFDHAIAIMKEGKQSIGATPLIVQNGFVYSVNSAQHFIDKEDYEKAIQFYKDALSFKTDRNVVNNIGILYERVIKQYLSENKRQSAQQLLKESQEIAPNHPALEQLQSQL